MHDEVPAEWLHARENTVDQGQIRHPGEVFDEIESDAADAALVGRRVCPAGRARKRGCRAEHVTVRVARFRGQCELRFVPRQTQAIVEFWRECRQLNRRSTAPSKSEPCGAWRCESCRF